ncbi:DUF2510 domain-containing protein [Miltoncostaea oceani]|uniref:DUF2510 domain-containing protein n=1 Tax=Miltoncostaea oceani TaxID=2843216 RepID=UPI001C3E61A1|nr:DUF2510 domain-containing protein [Miltoncostaea oceani]
MSWFDRGLLATQIAVAEGARREGARAAGSLARIESLQSEQVDQGEVLVGLARQLDLDLSSLMDAVVIQTVSLLEALSAQAGTLSDIRDALQRPGRVRAAERLLAADELLRRGRYKRAHDACCAAVDDDPNNPGVYWGLAFAEMGLGNFARASAALEEAAEAENGERRVLALRAAARAALEAGDPLRAATLSSAAQSSREWTGEERKLILAERAICEVAAGREDEAQLLATEMIGLDWNLGPLVLSSPFVSGAAAFREGLDRQLAAVAERVADLVIAAQESLVRCDTDIARFRSEAEAGAPLWPDSIPLQVAAHQILDSRGWTSLAECETATVQAAALAEAARDVGAVVHAMQRDLAGVERLLADAARAEGLDGPSDDTTLDIRRRLVHALGARTPDEGKQMIALVRRRAEPVLEDPAGYARRSALAQLQRRERAAATAAESAPTISAPNPNASRPISLDEYQRLISSVPVQGGGILRRQKPASPSWQPDPLGKWPYRWWDGAHWTEAVASTPGKSPYRAVLVRRPR